MGCPGSAHTVPARTAIRTYTGSCRRGSHSNGSWPPTCTGAARQHSPLGQGEVVVGDPPFVRQRPPAAEAGLVVGQHARLALAKPPAEGAADFAVARLGVYPVLANGARRQLAQPGRIRAEL